eukprot:GHVN01023694.1.p1 GENE.GHVN01023694.1~~GHVN01023694.1.p1  ORF type:complete len:1209 (+),score=291.12 GHVN01023694.1:243-3869(+)
MSESPTAMPPLDDLEDGDLSWEAQSGPNSPNLTQAQSGHNSPNHTQNTSPITSGCNSPKLPHNGSPNLSRQHRPSTENSLSPASTLPPNFIHRRLSGSISSRDTSMSRRSSMRPHISHRDLIRRESSLRPPLEFISSQLNSTPQKAHSVVTITADNADRVKALWLATSMLLFKEVVKLTEVSASLREEICGVMTCPEPKDPFEGLDSHTPFEGVDSHSPSASPRDRGGEGGGPTASPNITSHGTSVGQAIGKTPLIRPAASYITFDDADRPTGFHFPRFSQDMGEMLLGAAPHIRAMWMKRMNKVRDINVTVDMRGNTGIEPQLLAHMLAVNHETLERIIVEWHLSLSRRSGKSVIMEQLTDWWKFQADGRGPAAARTRLIDAIENTSPTIPESEHPFFVGHSFTSDNLRSRGPSPSPTPTRATSPTQTPITRFSRAPRRGRSRFTSQDSSVFSDALTQPISPPMDSMTLSGGAEGEDVDFEMSTMEISTNKYFFLKELAEATNRRHPVETASDPGDRHCGMSDDDKEEDDRWDALSVGSLCEFRENSSDIGEPSHWASTICSAIMDDYIPHFIFQKVESVELTFHNQAAIKFFATCYFPNCKRFSVIEKYPDYEAFTVKPLPTEGTPTASPSPTADGQHASPNSSSSNQQSEETGESGASGDGAESLETYREGRGLFATLLRLIKGMSQLNEAVIEVGPKNIQRYRHPQLTASASDLINGLLGCKHLTHLTCRFSAILASSLLEMTPTERPPLHKICIESANLILPEFPLKVIYALPSCLWIVRRIYIHFPLSSNWVVGIVGEGGDSLCCGLNVRRFLHLQAHNIEHISIGRIPRPLLDILCSTKAVKVPPLMPPHQLSSSPPSSPQRQSPPLSSHLTPHMCGDVKKLSPSYLPASEVGPSPLSTEALTAIHTAKGTGTGTATPVAVGTPTTSSSSVIRSPAHLTHTPPLTPQSGHLTHTPQLTPQSGHLTQTSTQVELSTLEAGRIPLPNVDDIEFENLTFDEYGRAACFLGACKIGPSSESSSVSGSRVIKVYAPPNAPDQLFQLCGPMVLEITSVTKLKSICQHSEVRRHLRGLVGHIQRMKAAAQYLNSLWLKKPPLESLEAWIDYPSTRHLASIEKLQALLNKYSSLRELRVFIRWYPVFLRQSDIFSEISPESHLLANGVNSCHFYRHIEAEQEIFDKEGRRVFVFRREARGFNLLSQFRM